MYALQYFPTWAFDMLNCVAATKMNAIVGGQTSCKAPEIAALEQYLPTDVDIVPCHSLHGPNVDPKGQPLVSSHSLIPSAYHG